MISFSKHILDNGLVFLYHFDGNTPLAAVNILYRVGARDEDPEKTGFAHLFEHLMFGGSAHIAHFDTELQKAGGQNNAFTTNDYTNYYDTVPVQNVETVLWLESDRMNALEFSERSLDVQKNVVVEEFRQRYLNQPFGDQWLKIRELAYRVHPYRWATIGKEISHIETATLEDVKNFFYRYYRPDNAILCIAGNIPENDALALTKKWFGDIPKGNLLPNSYPQEPAQDAKRSLTIEADVPCDSITLAFHAAAVSEEKYLAADLLAEAISQSESSLLYKRLVRDEMIFSEIYAYQSGNFDKGLFMIQGKLNEEFDLDFAEKKIWEVLEDLKTNGLPSADIQRTKNKRETAFEYGNISLLNRAMALCLYECLGDANLVNTEMERLQKLSDEFIIQQAKDIFRIENCNTLRYKKK